MYLMRWCVSTSEAALVPGKVSEHGFQDTPTTVAKARDERTARSTSWVPPGYRGQREEDILTAPVEREVSVEVGAVAPERGALAGLAPQPVLEKGKAKSL